jgi:osmotically inducible lipoprotein OsmB
MRRIFLPVAALVLLGTAACTNLNDTSQRMLSGGAIGTGAGVVTTAITGGCIWCGAAIGGAVGTGAGYVYDQITKGNL